MSSAKAGRAASAFAALYGNAPDGVWAAPGRVNLIGEHTDYNGGLALPIALPWRTYVALRPRADTVVRAASEGMPGKPVSVSLDEVGPLEPPGWTAYVAGVFWALRQAGHEVPGADLYVTSDVPVGAGLSSSAALECAVGAAVSDVAGLALLADPAGRARLAAACREAENVVAGAPTGGLDQSAALLCEAGHALLLDCRDGHTEQVPFDLGAHHLALLVVDTRTPHALVDGQYADRRRSCEQAAAALGVATLREVTPGSLTGVLGALPDERTRARVRHVVTEIERVGQFADAVSRHDFGPAGRLMTQSHLSLRDDYEVSCPQLDTAVEAALAVGALGARMTGGGFGGSAIALARVESVDELSAAIREAFGESGFRPPDIRVAQASAGASRVR